MYKIQKLTNEAVLILKESPLDIVHDLSHHERVLNIALKIAHRIDKNKVNLEALKVACMWHDVNPPVDKELVKFLEERLVYYGFEKMFSKKVIECIQTHSFEKRPKIVEAQILYDADKLDTLSLERGKKIAKSLLNRTMDWKKSKLYINVGKAWIKQMKKNLHFEVSREIHDKRVKELLSSKEVEELASKLNINLGDIKKSLYKSLSIKEKVIYSLTRRIL